MFYTYRLRPVKMGIALLLAVLTVAVIGATLRADDFSSAVMTGTQSDGTSYIKWVDYTPTLAVMEQALSYDVGSHGEEVELDWIRLIAYAAAKNGGKFKDRKNTDIDKMAAALRAGKTEKELTEGLQNYTYFVEAYTAVLGGFVGEYLAETAHPVLPGVYQLEPRYGLRVYSPIARGYGYSDYDDFGNARNYGYRRVHLGHDMMGSIGTPVVAVEDGVIEALGWNQYGGWRIGIRSHDGKRYYYYAHLRKNHPFVKSLKEGMSVRAGDVIGYLGMTGYSTKENVNNIKTPHLHFGMQLIFDESQKEGTNQIWIDVYQITRLLEKNRMTVQKNAETGDYERVNITYTVSPAAEEEEQIAYSQDALRANGVGGTSAGAGETARSVKLPIIMYHSLLRDTSRANAYVLSPDVLEADMKYLQAQGFTTIVMQDLIDYVYNGVPLPAKPVMLTFDDGYYNNYVYLYPLLQKYNMRAVISVIGLHSERFSDTADLNPTYGHLTWDNLGEMVYSGYVEVQNHSYDMHTSNRRQGSRRMNGESVEQYAAIFKKDLMHLQSLLWEQCGIAPTTFTYPFGFYSEESRALLIEMGFVASLLSHQKIAEVKEGDPQSLFGLPRYNRPSGTSTQAFMDQIMKALDSAQSGK